MSDEYKFGVEDVADKLGIEPASARIKLRNAKIKKLNGNKYGWKTKSELDEVVAKLKDTPAAPAKKDGAKAADKTKASAKSDKAKEPAAKAKAPAKKDGGDKAPVKGGAKKKAA